MNTTTELSADPRTDRTRQALIASAVRLIGERGYRATTVRQIADHAEANVAAINYHFGGKAGLRRATIEHVAVRMRKAGPGFLLSSLSAEEITRMNPAEARDVLRRLMMSGMKSNAVERDLSEVRAFIQRELFQGGESTRLFHDLVFSDVLDMMALLVSRMLGTDPSDKQTRMRAMMLLAQSVFLRMARPLVLLTMDWDDYAEDEQALVVDSFWMWPGPDPCSGPGR